MASKPSDSIWAPNSALARAVAPRRRPFLRLVPLVIVFVVPISEFSLNGLQLGFKFLFGRQVELVFRGVEVGVFRQGQLDHGVVFSGP